MANEGVITVDFADTERNDVTVAIRKSDNTIRDSQSAVALSDTGHLGYYTNLGAITIEAGDKVSVSVAGVPIGAGEEYQPELAATGFTEGGAMSVKTLYRLMAAKVAGILKLKLGETNIYQTLDPDNDSTIIMETTLKTEPEAGEFYKEVNIL